ncbi:TonB-dependent receptor plug domain-containing protein [Niabella hibiscisoli]|uniref:TonB-dependent receptor plug domain-containing protein n=1 Tax=Niabella hibiscisoli TaxID=1825928 RepID=UPI00374D2CE7
MTLNIRDAQANSLTGGTAEPLYVVDNMIVNKATFDNLDPSMVEDISILKDASAAIYGAAGAKGVVLITTKREKRVRPGSLTTDSLDIWMLLRFRKCFLPTIMPNCLTKAIN